MMSERRMRVLHIITRLIVGGAQENTLASVVRVDPERFESHLWVGPQTGAEGSLFEEARRRGVEPRVIESLVRELSPWKDFEALREMTDLLRREHFDLVHTHSSKAGILGRAAARLASVPVVIHTAHGWGFHEHMRWSKRALYVGLERLAVPWTTRLVSVSEETTRVGLAAGIGRAEDYTLIRSGIPLDRFGPSEDRRREARRRLGVAENELLVITVARLSAQKNPSDFLDVAEGVLGTGAAVRFAYVGDGPMRPQFESRLRERQVGNRVHLLGLRHDVPDLLCAADLFVLTSLWEGLPRVVPQALATGVPVVAYDVAGTREIVREGVNGFLVPPGDVSAMVERVRAISSDPELRRRLSRVALADFDRSFSEDEMIRGLEDLYASTLARRRESRGR